MSQKLAETICWMKSIFMIPQYLPLKSIISSLSCQIVKGIYSNPKKESEKSHHPPASAFQTAFFDKILLSSASAQNPLRCSEDGGMSEQCIHTSDCQLFSSLDRSELRTWFNTHTCPCPAHRGQSGPRQHLQQRGQPTRGSLISIY